jgi:AGCS family alanine or glycine:cation symporter
MASHVLRIVVMGLVFLGASAPAATSVFFFSDPMMGILAIVNLLALAMLFPTALRLLGDYRRQLREGTEHPKFDPDAFPDLNIDRAAWADVK